MISAAGLYGRSSSDRRPAFARYSHTPRRFSTVSMGFA